MLFNHVSAIIINLLFFDINHLLRKVIGIESIAVSPLMDCSSPSMAVQGDICFKASKSEFCIHIAMNNFSRSEIDSVHQAFADMVTEASIVLPVLCKNNLSIKYNRSFNKTIYTHQLKEIVLSIIEPDNERIIHIVFPFKFFSLFSNSITYISSPQQIEEETLHYFRNPKWMLPDIAYLLNSLSVSELSSLFNYLQKNTLLTPYQIFLLIQAYPELSGTIKNILSQNSINDVIQYNKDKHLKITKRDIAGGIYSIEESLLMIAREGIDIRFSRLMKHIHHIVQLSLRNDLLLKKTFTSWLAEIESQDLLYATVSITIDAVLAAAISRDSESYVPLLRRYLSERKINDITELINPAISYDEIKKAQGTFIMNYRKLKMKQIPMHPDRLEYLLSGFVNSDDYQYLLFSVGWFILSTALKGLSKRTISRVVDHLPFRAGILIEDVIKGIVNPNILHDEMQINKAKIRCVGSIRQLYHDGLINLE